MALTFQGKTFRTEDARSPAPVAVRGCAPGVIFGGISRNVNLAALSGALRLTG